MSKPYQSLLLTSQLGGLLYPRAELLLSPTDNRPPHGQLDQLPLPDLNDYKVVFIGELRERNCYLVMADFGDAEFAALGDFHSLREVLVQQDDDMFAMAARAKQIADYLQTHRFVVAVEHGCKQLTGN